MPINLEQFIAILKLMMSVLTSEQFRAFLDWLLSLGPTARDAHLSRYLDQRQYGGNLGVGSSCDPDNCPCVPEELQEIDVAILAACGE